MRIADCLRCEDIRLTADTGSLNSCRQILQELLIVAGLAVPRVRTCAREKLPLCGKHVRRPELRRACDARLLLCGPVDWICF